MRKLISVICALSVIVIVTLIVVIGHADLSTLGGELAAALVIVALSVLYWGWKPDIDHLVGKRRLDPRFDHIEAWLFYDPKISYEKGERSPRKSIPRWKLVCNTRTRYCYYVDDVVWSMIYNGRIRWHSVDEQDLQKWCDGMNYELIKQDAREPDLLNLGPTGTSTRNEVTKERLIDKSWIVNKEIILESETYETFSIDLQEQEHLFGEISSNNPVNVFLVNKYALNKFEGQEEFSYEDCGGGENITRTTIDFVSKKTARWFLVVENAAVEEARIEIHLWTTRRSA
jgi:hypothetical protein